MPNPERLIIGIGHKARHGKDTVADMIKHLGIIHGYGFVHMSFAKSLKKTTAAAFGLDEKIMFDDRKLDVLPFWSDVFARGVTAVYLLQLIGTDIFRSHVHEDIWVLNVTNQIINLPPDKHVVISDMRFPNETKMTKDLGGILIKVDATERLRLDNVDTVRNNQHPSETALDDFDGWDYVIDNNDTMSGLWIKVEKIFQEIKHLTSS